MVETSATDFARQAELIVAGVAIPPDPEVITPAIRRAMLEGRFEAEEASQIPHVVRPGDRVLEIGAGIGFISTLVARQRRVSRVIAVEANPHLLAYMARLHARNRVRKVRRINAVLTNGPAASATFYLRRAGWGR
jgi:2-polyprenyl-3-methyl-5-hydroxy-6-metoxy-1,4-benzoquinol methylase